MYPQLNSILQSPKKWSFASHLRSSSEPPLYWNVPPVPSSTSCLAVASPWAPRTSCGAPPRWARATQLGWARATWRADLHRRPRGGVVEKVWSQTRWWYGMIGMLQTNDLRMNCYYQVYSSYSSKMMLFGSPPKNPQNGSRTSNKVWGTIT